MKILEGPINCVLCGFQVWNGGMVETVPDGDEAQYVCMACFCRFGSEDHVLIKTSKERIAEFMPGVK